MSIKELIPVIFKVLLDVRVIATVVVMLAIVEFSKFVTSYKKRPPKPKKQKAEKAPAPKKEEPPAEESTEEAPAE